MRFEDRFVYISERKVANQRDSGKFGRLSEEDEKEEEGLRQDSGLNNQQPLQQYGLGQAQTEWAQVQQGSGFYPMNIMSGFVPVSSSNSPRMYSSGGSGSSSWVGHKRVREDDVRNDAVVGSSSHQDINNLHRNIADFRLPTSHENSSSGSIAFTSLFLSLCSTDTSKELPNVSVLEPRDTSKYWVWCLCLYLW